MKKIAFDDHGIEDYLLIKIAQVNRNHENFAGSEKSICVEHFEKKENLKGNIKSHNAV